MTAHSKIVASLLLLLAAIAIYHVTPVSAQVLNPVQTISGEQIVVIDGSYMISGSRHITVWNNNVDTGTMVKQIYTNYTEDIVAMDALNGFVYAATSNGPKSIQKWNYLTGQEMWSAPARGNSHQDTLTDMAVSNTGVYTSSADGTIKQWSLSTGSLVATVQIATGPSGFVAPILTMHVDRGTNRLFASFGRYKALDGVGRANLLPDGDFEDITTESYLESDGFFGMICEAGYKNL